MTSEDVIDTLAELLSMRGVPQTIRSDNGPEFVSKAIQKWLKQLQINALYIAPESPWKNGYAQSFHSKLVDEFLRLETFDSTRAARQQTVAWKDDYNHPRPHSLLGYMIPAEFAARSRLRGFTDGQEVRDFGRLHLLLKPFNNTGLNIDTDNFTTR